MGPEDRDSLEFRALKRMLTAEFACYIGADEFLVIAGSLPCA